MEDKEKNNEKATALPWRKPNTKMLWGREFKLVQAGLDVEQVSAIVNWLLTQTDSSIDLLPKTWETSVQPMPEIKPETMETTQANVEKITQTIKEQAAEMKRQAEEGEKTFTEIRERAGAIEEEVKEKTLVYLAGKVEKIEEEARKKYEEASIRFEEETRKEYEEASARFAAETRKEYEEASARFAAETKKEYDGARARFEEETRKECDEARARFEEETRKEYEETQARFEDELQKKYEVVYSRLGSAVQELLKAEQSLEADLRTTRQTMVEKKYSKLLDSMSDQVGNSDADVSDIENITDVKAEEKSEVIEQEEAESVPIQGQEKAVEEPTVDEQEEAKSEIEEQSGETFQDKAEVVETEDSPQRRSNFEDSPQELVKKRQTFFIIGEKKRKKNRLWRE